MATVTLTGTLLNSITNAPLKGKGWVEPSTPVLVDEGAGTVLIGGKPIVLDAAGSFSVVVRATDDPALTPINFTYWLKLGLNSGETLNLTFYAPAAIPVLDLSDFPAVDPSIGTPAPMGQITVSAVPPVSPYINQLWIPLT